EELFTMGTHDVVTGDANYSERDVKEIARAFTGWKFKQKHDKRYKYSFFVQSDQHDNTAKTIYGQTANFSGEDVIEVICGRRATARFLVKKLFEFFVYPLGDSNADHATIEKFATVYFSADHSIKSLVRSIFVSDEFFSDRARFGLVKSPAQLTVSLIRMLGVKYNPGNLQNGDFGLYETFKRMGFDLLNPFDVSGWRLNLGWLSTATVLQRYNFVTDLLSQREPDKHALGAILSDDQVKSFANLDAAQTVRNILNLLGPLNVGPDAVGMLADYLQTDDDGHRVTWAINDDTIDERVRGLVFLIMCLPEFQMN